MLALDTETYLFFPGLAAPKMVCGQLADKKSVRLLTPIEVKTVLETTTETLGFANAPYDLCVACAMFPELIERIFQLLEDGKIIDTHTRQPLLDLGRGSLLVAANGKLLERYSLKEITEKLLGIVIDKGAVRYTYAQRDGVPFDLWTDEERAYALNDGRYTYDVLEAQAKGNPEDPGIKNLALEIRENRANFALGLMRNWGIRTDPLMVEDVVQQVTTAHDAAVVKFTEAGIYRGEGWCRREKQCEEKEPHKIEVTCWKPWLPSKVGTRDGQWLQQLVTQAYQGEPPRTATGVSTDRDTLLESSDDLLMEFAETGRNEKEYSTYLNVIKQGTQVPINVEYDIIKRTTRKSARNPNLQNLPRGGRSRECFIAREGAVLCSADFPSLEFVTLAQNCHWMGFDSELRRILMDRKDPHVLLASMLEGYSYEEGMARKKIGDPRLTNMRQAAKPVNYGMGGGMGVDKLILYCRQPSNGGIRFCLLEGAGKCGVEKFLSEHLRKPLCTACFPIAKRFRQAWFEMLPEMKDYFSRVGRETLIPEDALIEVWGPPGEPTLYVRGRKFSEASNLRFQGLAARLEKDAIWKVSKACYVEKKSPLYGCRPCLDAHDELIVEMPEDLANDAAWELARIMTETRDYWCPDVPYEPVEPALMRRWFKKAEKVVGKDGKLVPWWPKDWSWKPDQEIMKRDRERCI